MKHDILLPQVELNMESVEVVRWLVAVGDRVKAEQPILEVETQKAVIEVPAPREGFIRVLHVGAGDEIAEKALLATLTDQPDEATTIVGASTAIQVREPEADVVSCSLSTALDVGRAEHESNGRYPVRATPLARKVARDLGVDLRKVAGTGPSGRVRHADVRAFKSSTAIEVAEPRSLIPPPAHRSGVSDELGDVDAGSWTPLPATRRALIEQMQRALTRIPQINLVRQMDVTPLLAKAEGITFTHRLIASLACALKRHPSLRTITDGLRLRTAPVSVAVAMDTPHGLVAPVLRAADSLSLAQISVAVTSLRDKAQAGSLRRADLIDGPFALTNLGMFGVDLFDPLVFDGQTAVLAVGRATEAPAGRRVAWFTLAVDHRVVDGAEAARFLQAVQQEIEH